MLNENSREQLEEILFNNYLTNVIYIEKINKINLAYKNKINPIKITKVFSNQLDIEMLADYELYYLCKALLNNGAKTKDLGVKKYFTIVEINDFENIPDIKDNEDMGNIVVIDNVEEINPNKEWRTAKVSVHDLKSFMDRGLITYNPKTQRPTIKKRVGNEIKEKINVNPKSVKDIKKLILTNEYYPSMMTFNILENGFEKFRYDKENRKLIITVDERSEVDIIDGWHNYRALISALRENPNIELYYPLEIHRGDELMANNYIGMRNKQNLFKEEQKSYYDTMDIYNLMAHEINNDKTAQTNFMKNKLGKDSNEVKLINKYCTFAVLSKAIKDNFKINNKKIRETRHKKEYLIDFFKELISILDDDFNNVRESRKKSYATYSHMFFGYVALASRLYGQDNWQDKLFDVIAEIDFSKGNKEWKGKGLDNSIKFVPMQIRKLYNYFLNLYDSMYNKEESKEAK